MPAKKKERRALTIGRGEVAARAAQTSPPTRVIALDAIEPRPGGDTRTLDPEHVVTLAESIDALGLLEPVVIDLDSHLLAGGHRLAACRLLCAEPDDRYARALDLLEAEALDDGLAARLVALGPGAASGDRSEVSEIPARVISVHAGEDLDAALAVEVAENEQRRDYTREEVVALYERLMASGRYVDRRGRLAEGERAAKPAIAAVIGKSLRTVHRLLKPKAKPKAEPIEARDPGPPLPFGDVEDAVIVSETPAPTTARVGDVFLGGLSGLTDAQQDDLASRADDDAAWEETVALNAPSVAFESPIPADIAEEIGPVEAARRALIMAARRYHALGSEVIGDDAAFCVEDLLAELGEDI